MLCIKTADDYQNRSDELAVQHYQAEVVVPKASCAPRFEFVDLIEQAVLNYRLGMSVLSREIVVRERICNASGIRTTMRSEHGNQLQCVLTSAPRSKQV